MESRYTHGRMTHAIHFTDESDWDADNEELHREHDAVPPTLELRLAQPSDETLTRLAEVLRDHGASPASVWNRVLIAGPFVRVCLPGATVSKAVAQARALVVEVARAIDLTEAAMLAPIVVPLLPDPGPAWPGWRVRAVDPSLPDPAPHPAVDAVFANEEAREALARTGLVATYGEPAPVDGLPEALRTYGTDFGASHRVLELIRWEEPAASYLAARLRVFGLLEDGRFCLFASSTRKDEPFDPAHAPGEGWILSRKARTFDEQVKNALRRYGVTATFDPTPLLRDTFAAFAKGDAVHKTAFRWLARSSLLQDPTIRAALDRRRAEARWAQPIADILAPSKPAAKESKADKRARRKAKRARSKGRGER